ncbi:hypothetical protein EsH8_I_000289 [Colletotrichum jinshuiense]
MLSGGLEGFLQRIRDDDSFREDTDEWDADQNEAFLPSRSLQMYRSETAAFEKLGGFQGKLVPRLLMPVVLATAPKGVHDCCRERSQVRGILLQHIPGFKLSELETRAPSSSWQDILNQAVRIARVLGDNDILNKDVRPDNFIVQEPKSRDASVSAISGCQKRHAR